MPVHRRFTLPPLAALIFGVIVLGVAGCGYSSSSKDVVAGQTVTLGKLQYTVVFSRYLNPNDSEDAAFLVGQPPPPRPPTITRIFLQVQNEDSRPHLLPKSLKIHRHHPARSSRRSPAAAFSRMPAGRYGRQAKNRSRCSTPPRSRDRSKVPSSLSGFPPKSPPTAADALHPRVRRAGRGNARSLAGAPLFKDRRRGPSPPPGRRLRPPRLRRR